MSLQGNIRITFNDIVILTEIGENWVQMMEEMFFVVLIMLLKDIEKYIIFKQDSRR